MKLTLLAGSLIALAPALHADVFELEAFLDGAQEAPPVATAATGHGIVTVDTDTNFVHVRGTYTSMTASVTAAHLHGLAPPGMGAGILIPLVHSGGTSGSFEGSGSLTGAEVSGILQGQSYLNLHSSFSPSGEIRGQVERQSVSIPFTADGPQEPSISPGIGSGTVIVNPHTGQVTLTGTYSALMGSISAAHLHRGYFGMGGSILLPLTHTGGTSGTISGNGILAPADIQDVLDGFSYVNYHTGIFPLGEIRGQVEDGFLGINYCEVELNSSGLPAQIEATGSMLAADQDLTLTASSLPANQFAFFIGGKGTQPIFPVTNSSGRICIGGAPIARFQGQVMNSGPMGTITAAINIGSIPANPTVAAVAGDTWNFQSWTRDTAAPPGMTSNFSNAVSITYR